MAGRTAGVPRRAWASLGGMREAIPSLQDLTAAPGGPVLLDGAIATELEQRGVDTSSALWSAVAMRDAPAAVVDVHRSYLDAGARIITTNSYQAHPRAFVAAGVPPEGADELVRSSARLALQAVDQWHAAGHGEPAVVVGSLGPYGAYLADGSEYTGAYQLDEAGYADFHRPRIALLHEVGIHAFLLETQPRPDEVVAVCRLLERDFPNSALLVSFSLGEPTRLPDGTPLAVAAAALDGFRAVLAVGVNCVPREWVEPALEALRGATSLPLMAYPNSGETYHPETKTWSDPVDAQPLDELVPAWRRAGAGIIGGCCRTSPATIAEVRRIAGSEL